MNVVLTTAEMRDITRNIQRSGETIALVPTMGALHEGHLSLVREAGKAASKVIVSIFVNPRQFGPTEDFARYPRDLEADLRRLATLKVDYVFAPAAQDFYPDDFQTRIDLERLPQHLCGLSRAGHFPGVATVVAKLFLVCRPDVAVFGMKDFQQVRVIEQLVKDLGLDLRIVRHPTVREADGLALSSRNRYLSAEDRTRALALSSVLRQIAEAISAGKTDPAPLIEAGRARLAEAGVDVEYLSICDADTLDDVAAVAGPVLVAVAGRVGTTRLIDNVLASPHAASR